jgi:DNA-binding NarL/FixJ family response regulator
MEKKTQTSETETKKGSVLLVDDNKLMSEAIVSLLKMSKFAVDAVTFPQEGYKLLAKNHYDHLIVDGLNGQWEGLAKMALNLGLKVTLCTSNVDRYKNNELIVSGQVTSVAKGNGGQTNDELLVSLTSKTK